MNTQPDFEDFLRLLEGARVEYMIVGGYAVAFHGFPRFTKDIDIFFDMSAANLDRICRVLVEFGFRAESVDRTALETLGNVIAIGVPPVRIDLVNHIDGVTFAEAQANTVRGKYGGVDVTFIGLQDLIRNKSSTSRAKDKADVEELS
jgi:predicted nucleotidyltransferase